MCEELPYRFLKHPLLQPGIQSAALQRSHNSSSKKTDIKPGLDSRINAPSKPPSSAEAAQQSSTIPLQARFILMFDIIRRVFAHEASDHVGRELACCAFVLGCAPESTSHRPWCYNRKHKCQYRRLWVGGRMRKPLCELRSAIQTTKITASARQTQGALGRFCIS